MKNLNQIRNKIVFDKIIDKVSVKIIKSQKGFQAFVDGDLLDVYKSQGQAEKMAKEFLKQLKGN